MNSCRQRDGRAEAEGHAASAGALSRGRECVGRAEDEGHAASAGALSRGRARDGWECVRGEGLRRLLARAAVTRVDVDHASWS